jgi:methylase of polypeptide subunit release factors
VAAAGEAKWATEPFIMGTPEQFARLREWLVSAGYTEARVRSIAGVDSMYALPSLTDGREVFREPTDLLSLIVQLFLDGCRIPWSTVNAVISSPGRGILDALGLLQPSVANPELCAAAVALYPIDGVYFASDRLGGLETVGTGVPSDLVFSALTPLTHAFVARMPRIPCADYLELCSGTGIAALIAAHEFADRSWAVDITERSTRFATFNAMLNGLTNVTVLQGDLYEPVLGQTFDLITAHPPYVPSFDNDMVFRDGGEDGEQITQAIIAGLPQYLRPGGQFFCACAMSDRRGARLEQRVRTMLGSMEPEFDVIVVQASVSDPVALFGEMVREGRSTGELFERRIAAFTRHEIETFVAGEIIVQRRKTLRAVGTRRRIASVTATAADLQWLLRYTAGTAAWGDDELRALLDARPRCLPQTELHTQSVLREGAWAPRAGQLEIGAPFAMRAECPPWFPIFLAWCDGTASVRELYHRLLDEERIGASGSEAEFARLVFQLADAPFLELPMFPLPRAEAGSLAME